MARVTATLNTRAEGIFDSTASICGRITNAPEDDRRITNAPETFFIRHFNFKYFTLTHYKCARVLQALTIISSLPTAVPVF